MPTYYTTTSTTAYPYNEHYWSTSTTTDCSGYTWAAYKKSEAEYLKYWIDSLKEPQISEDDVLKLIEGDA
ncbi:MAG: hypothetical protein J6Y78_15955 [Paludibacteraceae bacterium]|nr:hypothetical protein [Paludibacteraceae bacterium]